MQRLLRHAFHPSGPTARLLLLFTAVGLIAPVAAAQTPPQLHFYPRDFKNGTGPTPSGIFDVRAANLGSAITECPQARLANVFPEPLDRRNRDAVEQYSDRGNDLRTNEEFSCLPQNETTIAVNPTRSGNIIAGANDYRMGVGSSGVYASVDGGRTWYGSIIPFPTTPFGQGFLVSGGDPAIVFDRAGIAYYAMIAFNRDDDSNGVFVSRSTNGGYTWTRARVAGGPPPAPPTPVVAGDGVVVVEQDNNTLPDGSVTIHDKEYIAAGPRPQGVAPQCFNAAHALMAACDPAFVGVDRLYVTWSAFNPFTFNPCPIPELPSPCTLLVNSTIEVSYSDDQARSWSPRRTISGTAEFCVGAIVSENGCDDNQFSTPTVSPDSGFLYVAFENFNAPDENQYLVVRSHDGGRTFQGPFFVTPVFDVNFPRAGGEPFNRPDCTTPRGQDPGRIVYTNSCFRSNAAGNIVVDKRTGAFADDLYLVMSDNRNGTAVSSNADVFLFKSVDGGMNWIGPTRVNDDPSGIPAVRDCGRAGTCPAGVHTGNDQWWPWVDINDRGHLNVVFSDRRLDFNSVRHEWAGVGSRQRPGNYLVWFWGAQCTVDHPDSRECLSRAARKIRQPTAPINPGNMVVPGQGNDFVGRFDNFGISDTASNWDYSFRGGIFAGDYNAVTVDPNGRTAYGFWTDARNGRSSGNPFPPGTFQFGRNPTCEQSDVMVQAYDSALGGRDRFRDDDDGSGEGGGSPGQSRPRRQDSLFLVTPCPVDAGGHGR
jgi:hypothetical protein